MLRRLRELFGGEAPVKVQGTGALPEGQARVVALGDALAGGVEVVLCRVGGKLHALDRRCPHENGRILGGPLAEGRYAVCPLHNYKFDPASGRAVGVACGNAKVYRVREKDGEAHLWL